MGKGHQRFVEDNAVGGVGPRDDDVAQFVDAEGMDRNQGDGELVSGVVQGVEQAAEPVAGQWPWQAACASPDRQDLDAGDHHLP
ncbi:hypothetical protein EEB14_09150 [Rhodococcus sp. WS4]|nr:hypothetical protein EEB14_09150 [Rhodococcus sp. WS4]